MAPEQPLVGAGSNQKRLEECHDWKAGWPAFGVASHALGIHGQYLFVDAEQQLAVAKVSSEGLPLDAARITLTLRAVSALLSALAG